ncbi:hypothetical protein HDU67_000957 [Dinochytrium kinnereticum]|nr:hypothetical protein HDU67_000957 [Dinochytrium kinnereticum]
MANKRHRDRQDAVDVTLKRIMEACFPQETAALGLIADGTRRLEMIRRDHLKRLHASVKVVGGVPAGGLLDSVDSTLDMDVDDDDDDGPISSSPLAFPSPSIMASTHPFTATSASSYPPTSAPPSLTRDPLTPPHHALTSSEHMDSIPLIIQECFSRAIDMAPDVAKGYVMRAQAYLTLGYVRSARMDANTAVALRPESLVVKELLKRVGDTERCTGMSGIAEHSFPAQSHEGKHPSETVLISACAQSLECTLCFSMLGDPVTAPCGHSWCRCCLLQSLSHANACPLCRRTLPPYIYFEKRPRNLTLSRIIDHIQTVIKSFPTSSVPSISVSSPPTCSTTAGACLELPPVTETSEATTAALAASKTIIIPIFVGPLVFPGVPCFMHIFEPRYRGMVSRLMKEGQRTFGLCLPEPKSDEGVETRVGRTGGASSKALMPCTLDAAVSSSEKSDGDEMDATGSGRVFESFPSSATVGVCTGGACQKYLPVGTLLRIRSCEPVMDQPEGELPRFLIDAVGVSRFRVLQRGLSDGGYNVALVERLEDVELDDEDQSLLSAAAAAAAAAAAETAVSGSDMDTSPPSVQQSRGITGSFEAPDYGSSLVRGGMERRASSHPGVASFSLGANGTETKEGCSPPRKDLCQVLSEASGIRFDFDCPVTAFFNSNFRCPSRPSMLRGSLSCASPTSPAGSLADGKGGSSSSFSSPQSDGVAFGSTRVPETGSKSAALMNMDEPPSTPPTPLSVCPFDAIKSFLSSQSSSLCRSSSTPLSSPHSSSTASSLTDHPTTSTHSSSPPPSSTHSGVNKHHRKKRDPYSRLSTLRCRLLSILSTLPPQARRHLDLLNGPPPVETAALSFWMANMAPVGDYRKYGMLTSTSVSERVEMVVDLFEEDGVMERLEATAALMVSGGRAAGGAGLACGCAVGSCSCRGRGGSRVRGRSGAVVGGENHHHHHHQHGGDSVLHQTNQRHHTAFVPPHQGGTRRGVPGDQYPDRQCSLM